MNRTIMRKVIVSADYRPLAARSLRGSFEISAAPGNTGSVFFRGDDGSDVPWMPGEYHSFRQVDLAEIRVKGTAGDVVTVIGGTW